MMSKALTVSVLLASGGATANQDPFGQFLPPALERANAVVQRSSIPFRSTLSPGLIERLGAANPDEHIPISIVMKEQISPDALSIAVGAVPRHERRDASVRLLRDHAERTTAELVDLLEQRRLDGSVGGRVNALWLHAIVTAHATPDIIREIADRPDVAHINYDRPVGEEVLLSRADPEGIPTCGVELVRAPEVWKTLGYTGRGVVVGVIDTGTCMNHPDLTSQIWTNPCEKLDGTDTCGNGYIDDVHGWNFRDDNNDLSDYNSHGTHVAGTVLGDGSEGTQTGIAPNADLMTLKIWSSFSGESTVWEAMQYGVANGAQILTASLGWPQSKDPDRATWRQLCEMAMAAGVVVIYAAGNESNCCPPAGSVRTPGDVPDVISVGAIDCSSNLATFSSHGPVTWQTITPWKDWPLPPGKIKPTVVAPGVNATSTSNKCYGYFVNSGTSMATPHVAGTVALMLEANPCLDHYAVKNILKMTAVDLGEIGPDNKYGHGRIDAFEAVLLAKAMVRPADLNCDGIVDGGDLGILLPKWGPCKDCEDCPADISGDCIVNGLDLGLLLADWG